MATQARLAFMVDRRCSTCGVEKPLTDFYYNKSTRCHSPLCKPCQMKRYPSRPAYQKEYAAKNAMRLKDYNKKYRMEHPHVDYEAKRRWKKQNADKVRQYWHIRRARKLKVGGVVTPEEWAAIKDKWDHRCLWCLRRVPEIRICQDHVIPLVWGGANLAWNIQPLCVGCNCKKGRSVIDFRVHPDEFTAALQELK